MKLPKLIIILAVILLAVGGGYFYFKQASPIKTLDDFPIMLINNGQTAVYQEVTVSKNKLEKQIVISNLGQDNQKGVKIYEYIPKEMAQKASDLNFSIQPQILEDDPIVLWQVEPSIPQPVHLSYSVKVAWETTQCIDKGFAADMKNVYKLDPYNFDDCYKYLHIKFLNAVYQNQKRREQEEKDKMQLIQPGEAKYTEIQQRAKEIISPRKSNAKISKEEAISIVQKTFTKELAGLGSNSDFKDATCERAEYIESERKWHIFCTRPAWEVGYTHEICKTSVQFISVTNDGKANIEGSYSDCYGGQSGHKVFGKPMWGVQ